jgi:hypothetical protein
MKHFHFSWKISCLVHCLAPESNVVLEGHLLGHLIRVCLLFNSAIPPPQVQESTHYILFPWAPASPVQDSVNLELFSNYSFQHIISPHPACKDFRASGAGRRSRASEGNCSLSLKMYRAQAGKSLPSLETWKRSFSASKCKPEFLPQ